MLRRPERTAAGESWLLVPQAEHAQLAGALAAHWGDATLAGLRPHGEALAAISHHDDGCATGTPSRTLTPWPDDR